MNSQIPAVSDPTRAVDRLVAATNAHDIDTLVSCFAPDYSLANPAHPARSFTGRDQVRRNWTALFAGVPDLRCEVTATAVAGDMVWTEMAMSGSRRDGHRHEMAGVMVFRVTQGQISEGRFFLEAVDHAAIDNDTVIERLTRSPR